MAMHQRHNPDNPLGSSQQCSVILKYESIQTETEEKRACLSVSLKPLFHPVVASKCAASSGKFSRHAVRERREEGTKRERRSASH